MPKCIDSLTMAVCSPLSALQRGNAGFTIRAQQDLQSHVCTLCVCSRRRNPIKQELLTKYSVFGSKMERTRTLSQLLEGTH
jgi:hypothetical protein